MDLRLHYVILILSSILLGVSALRCYECSSETDPECLENFDTGNEARFLQPTDCEVFGARYCVKTTGVYGGVVGTRRFCSSRDFHDICQYITYPQHDRVYRACVFTCSTDDCNTGHTTKVSVIVLFTAMLYSICTYFL